MVVTLQPFLAKSTRFLLNNRISLPSTLLEIAPDFYFEDCIDSPDYPPYISVHPDNPVFYAKEGTLFFKKNGQVAIAHSYNGKNPSSRY